MKTLGSATQNRGSHIECLLLSRLIKTWSTAGRLRRGPCRSMAHDIKADYLDEAPVCNSGWYDV